MSFVSLKKRPEYFDQVTELFFREWKPLFETNGYTTIEDVRAYYKRLKNATTIMYLEKSTLIGCYTLLLKNGSMYLCDVLVVPEKRNTGVGAKLMRDAINRSIDAGWTTLHLYASDDKLGFYQRYGFYLVKKTKRGDYLMMRSPTQNSSPKSFKYLMLLIFVVALIAILWIVMK